MGVGGGEGVKKVHLLLEHLSLEVTCISSAHIPLAVPSQMARFSVSAWEMKPVARKPYLGSKSAL